MTAEDENDSKLFRDAASGTRPLEHEERAPLQRRVAPKARFGRQEAEQVLRESVEAEFDPREIDSADSLHFRRPSVGKRTMRRLSRGGFAVQAELDLHGLTVSEAREVLQEFILDACLRGYTCVRVVHGKGLGSGERGPVLKRKTASLLRRWQAVLAFVSARQIDGGTGAIYVLLDPDGSAPDAS